VEGGQKLWRLGGSPFLKKKKREKLKDFVGPESD
jgi:hypothetical protein